MTTRDNNQMAGEVVGMHHAAVIVADTSVALAFYRDLLRLEVSQERVGMSNSGAWLQLPDGRQIHLLEVSNPDSVHNRPEHGGHDRHFALLVDNLDALEERLRAANIKLTSSASGRRALFCRDPDGNAVELVQLPASG